jgi:hypothetical protein
MILRPGPRRSRLTGRYGAFGRSPGEREYLGDARGAAGPEVRPRHPSALPARSWTGDPDHRIAPAAPHAAVRF